MGKYLRIFVHMMLLVLGVVLLSSCADSSSDVETTRAPDLVVTASPSVSDSFAGANESVEISFWFPQDVQAICEEYIDLYCTMNPDAVITTKVFSWSDYWTETATALAGGSGPDIYWMNTAYEYSLLQYALPIAGDVVSEEYLSENFRNYDIHEVDGEIYYVDIGYTYKIVMYNIDMWENAGLDDSDIPTTWAQFKDVAEKLTIYGEYDNILVSGFDFSGSDNFLNLLIAMNYQDGYFQYNEDGTATLFDNSATTSNLNYLQSFINGNISEISTTANRDALGSWETAMICDWTWVYLYLDYVYPNVDVGVFAIPQDYNAVASDMMYSDVSPAITASGDSEKQEAAADFLQFLLDCDDFFVDYSVANLLYPSRYSVEDRYEITSNPVLSVMAETIDRNVLTRVANSDTEWIKIDYLQNNFLSGELTAYKAGGQCDYYSYFALPINGFDPLERKYIYADDFNN